MGSRKLKFAIAEKSLIKAPFCSGKASVIFKIHSVQKDIYTIPNVFLSDVRIDNQKSPQKRAFDFKRKKENSQYFAVSPQRRRIPTPT